MRTEFLLVLAYLLVARALEVATSKRRTAELLERGGRRVRPDGFVGILAVHVLWFVGLVVEEAFVGVSLESGAVRSAFAAVAVASELLRLWAIRSLGDRWSMHVVVLPGVPPVRRGPYRFLRHPNYLAIAVQLVALPLALGLVWTGVIVMPLKVLALRGRIRVEDGALGSG